MFVSTVFGFCRNVRLLSRSMKPANSNRIMKPAKWLLLATCAFWLAIMASASEVDSKTAALTVKGWLQMGGQPYGKALGTQVKSVDTYKDGAGKPLYHVVYLKPSGFVIVSAEDQTKPIIAIVKDGQFDPSPANPLGALIAKDLPKRVAHARSKGASQAGLKHRDEWLRLQGTAAGGAQPNGLSTGSIWDIRVAPFVPTHWSQTTSDDTTNGPACYNFFTPPFAAGSSGNYACGCIATALAQLMYYFQYPAVGVGTPSYTITLTTPLGGIHDMLRSLRGGDGQGGPYLWTSMSLDPKLGATVGQRAAIGALTADASVAVHMSYTPTGSGAFMSDAKTALVTAFKYNNAVVVEASSLNVGFDLTDMLNPNLDARLPVLFGIDNSQGGHAIVCDGYGYDGFATLYHHLNMGWSGLDDAWYALPIIDLDDTVPFINIDACLYNAFTNAGGEIISGRVLAAGGTPVPNASVSAIGTKGTIYSAVTDSQGIYALSGVPSSATFTLTVTDSGYFPVSSNYTTGTSSDESASCGNIWGANFTLVPAQGPPVISTQPQDETVTVQTNAIFSLMAGGQLPLSYHWQFQPAGTLNWNDLSDGGNYSGSGTATLTVSQTDTSMDGEPLRCIVSNSVGSVTSSVAVLRVSVAPFIEITTIAGLAGTNGSSDGIGANASFNNPRGIAVDSNTNVYVADMYNHVIRKLTPSGAGWAVSTIAGLAGNSGSTDGANGNARFSSPYGVAVDGVGNVYVADTGNSTIRKLSPAGTDWVVSTMGGLAGSPGTNNGTGSSARFRYPTGLAVDGGGIVYVADQGNSTIRRLAPSGGSWVITTIAGSAGAFGSADGTNAVARFGEPYGITVDQNGILYVADKYSDTIRKVGPSGTDWVVTTIAGLVGNVGSSDGVGTGARFNNPTGIAAGKDGNLYVADQGNNTIRRMSPAGTNWIVFTIAGLAGSSGSTDGIGDAIRFNAPFGIAVDNNTNIYVSDSINCTIRMDPLSAPPTQLFIQMVKQQSDGTLTLSWSAKAEHQYRVQFKSDLAQPAWSDLTAITPPSWTATVAVPMGPDVRRFYRVVLVQ
jgi:streptogramin lyase